MNLVSLSRFILAAPNNRPLFGADFLYCTLDDEAFRCDLDSTQSVYSSDLIAVLDIAVSRFNIQTKETEE